LTKFLSGIIVEILSGPLLARENGHTAFASREANMHNWLRREVNESRRDGRTTTAIRRFVLGIVDESLREHFGENYSDRCFQSSMAVKETLQRLEIESTLGNGHVCMSRVTILDENSLEYGWAGFWDQHDHVWAFDEFGELIDLTISQLHLHSASAGRGDLAIPAIWWDDVNGWPSTMLYLPAGHPIAEFSPEETADTEAFMAKVREKLDITVDEESGPAYQDAILSGEVTLNELLAARHPWALCSSLAQEVPRPQWILNRIEELSRQAEKMSPGKKRQPSRVPAPKKRVQAKKKKTKKRGS
jgi:hypothetical protein